MTNSTPLYVYVFTVTVISEYHALSHVRYPWLGVGVELTLAMQQKKSIPNGIESRLAHS